MSQSHTATPSLLGRPSLNSLVSPEQLAKARGWSIRTHGTNGYVVCPLCRRGKMYFVPEPLRGGTYWFCDNCRWSGTSISLYQATGDEDISCDTRAAWNSLENTLLLRRKPPWDGEGPIQDYVAWEQGQQRIQEIVQGMCQRMAERLPARAVSTLEQIGAWGGWTVRNFRGEMGRFCGCASIRDIEELSSLAHVPSSGGWARRGYNMSLAVPHEILPGLYGRVSFLSEHRDIRSVDIQPVPGVIGYSESTRNTERAIAIPRIEDFLSFQRQWLTSRGTGLPLVCVGGSMDSAAGRCLSRLPHSRVYCWDYQDHDKSAIFLLDCARAVGSGGYATQDPKAKTPEQNDQGEQDCSLVCQTHNITRFMKAVDKSAMSWPKAIKEFLTLCSSPDLTQQLSFLDPPLEPEELDLIKKECDGREWDVLQTKTQRVGQSRVFRYRGDQFIEREGEGWYRINPRPGYSGRTEERVFNGIIELRDKYVVDGETYVTGVLRVEKHEIPFADKMSKISNNPRNYFQTLATHHEAPTLDIKNGWKSRLWGLALVAHPPRTVRLPDRIGWSKDDGFWKFVRLDLRTDGTYTSYPNDPDTPCKRPGRGVVVPEGFKGSSLEWWASRRPEVELAWSFVIATLHNLSSRYAGHKTLGFLIDADTYPAVSEHMDLFGQALELNRFRVSRGSDSQSDLMSDMERSDDLPVLFSCAQSGAPWWRSWVRHGLPHNCIFAGSARDAMRALAGPGWTFITGDWLKLPMVSDEPPQVGVLLSLILPAFAEAMKEHPMGVSVLRSVQGDLYKKAPQVLERAVRRFTPCPPTSWERLMWLLFVARDEGVLRIEGKDSSPLWQDAHGNVRVHWEQVHKRLARHDVQLPDIVELDEAEKHFKGVHAHPDGWWIDRDTWESQVSLWRSVFSPGPGSEGVDS